MHRIFGAALEDVGHRRAEHAVTLARLLGGAVPLEGLGPVLVAEGAARSVGAPNLEADALREGLSVAVVAAG